MTDDFTHPESEDARIEAILRSMTDVDLTLETPPADVWTGIEQALEADAEAPTGEGAVVVDLASRRTRRITLALGAVAAAVALVVGLSAVFTSDDAAVREVASAELVFADDFEPAGQGHSAVATLVEDDAGQHIRFDAADIPAPVPGEDVELWLIGVDDAGEIAIIQPVGILDDLTDPGTFDVPEGFSTDDYATVAVDLSFEPRDGVETHSGRSILRGPLSA